MARKYEKVTKEQVYEEYYLNGKSDYQIAAELGTVRSTVTYIRKREGMDARRGVRAITVKAAADALRKQGYTAIEKPLTHEFSLLVDGLIRVSVKGSMLHDGGWYYSLTDRPDTGLKHDPGRFKLMDSGRYRKDLCQTCDVLMLCGFINRDKPTLHKIFILPPKAIPLKQGGLQIRADYKGKWWEYHNNFDLLDDVLMAKKELCR